MVTKRLLLFICIVSVGLFLHTTHTYAHVLLSDATGNYGVVLHITPDDNPLAGKPATILYDVKSSELASYMSKSSLTITDQNGETTNVALARTSSTASAVYAFPTEGVYTLQLTLENSASAVPKITFIQTQRIAGTTTIQQTPTIAIAGLVFSGTGMLLLGILAYNNRYAIAGHGKHP